MAQKIDVALPEEIILGGGYIVEWDAVDPTTGASVSGVVITEANVTAVELGEGQGNGSPLGPYMLVPGPSA